MGGDGIGRERDRSNINIILMSEILKNFKLKMVVHSSFFLFLLYNALCSKFNALEMITMIT